MIECDFLQEPRFRFFKTFVVVVERRLKPRRTRLDTPSAENRPIYLHGDGK